MVFSSIHNSTMPSTGQSLWQILLQVAASEGTATLNCDDCFSILEYLAETKHQIGADIDLLHKIARKHLSCCPDCRQHYLAKLEELEQNQQTQKSAG